MSKAIESKRGPSLVLALLLIAYIFNFLDRQIVGILGPSIQAELHLSNAEFGAIGGTAFALLYAVLGIPLAYLADRTSRSAVVAGSLGVWSAFTALCGAVTGYWTLFLCRLGVGVGEAGGVAPSYALIADYFPPDRRARALAIFSLGVPIGLGAGSFIGGQLAARFGWREAFAILGIAGLALAPALRFVVRDVAKPVFVSTPSPLLTVFPMLARNPAFWLLAFAASASSLCGYGLALWTPKVMMLSFGLDLVSTGNFLASLWLIGGCAGVFAGGWLADRLGSSDRGWYAKLPAIAWLISIPAWGLGLLAPNLWIAWPLLLVGSAVNILWLGPIVTAVQHLVPRAMRSTASASFLLINNLIGLGVGPWLMGRLSDGLEATHGANALRDAAVACLGFYLLAALLVVLSLGSLKGSWIADREQITI
ncbi:MAG TPA: MFS transporter [Sphingomicrobium sp.]|nr:MFS transporter [Sphingomicrobium sp.]